MSIEETGQVNALTVSDQLRQAREAAGLTQADVADELFLTETYIRSIDAGEFERLPKQAFVRGYLRSYGRVVGLDGGLLVQLYDEESRETLPEMPAYVSVSVEENRFSGPVVLTGLIGLGIVLILVLLVWLLTPGDDRAGAKTPAAAEPALVAKPGAEITNDGLPDTIAVETAPVESESLDKTLDQEATSATEVPAPDLVANFEQAGVVVAPEKPIAKTENPTSARINQNADPLVLAAAVRAPEPLVTGGGDGDPDGLANQAERSDQLSERRQVNFNLDVGRGISQQVNIRRENRGDGRQISVDAGGSDELKATLIGECWIEVADSQNELIYGDLNRAGDVLVLTGRAPLTVLLGNAPMASIEFNGRAINLDPATTRDAIARLTLTN